MTVLEFIGEVDPWPKSLDVDEVERCKSRLLLQGRALRHGLRNTELEHILGRACTRGAAEWETRLLRHRPLGEPEREAAAASALTLARDAGDWLLVGEVLDAWSEAETSAHADLRAEIAAEYAARPPAVDHALLEVVDVYVTRLVQTSSARDARTLLRLTDDYENYGGSWRLLLARAAAYAACEEWAHARSTLLMACIAHPTSAFLPAIWHKWSATDGFRASDVARF